MKIRYLLVAVPLLALAGCETSAVVADISDSAVHVQTNGQPTDPKVRSEANRGCGQYGKTATYMSHHCLDNYCIRKDVLFTCS